MADYTRAYAQLSRRWTLKTVTQGSPSHNYFSKLSRRLIKPGQAWSDFYDDMDELSISEPPTPFWDGDENPTRLTEIREENEEDEFAVDVDTDTPMIILQTPHDENNTPSDSNPFTIPKSASTFDNTMSAISSSSKTSLKLRVSRRAKVFSHNTVRWRREIKDELVRGGKTIGKLVKRW